MSRKLEELRQEEIHLDYSLDELSKQKKDATAIKEFFEDHYAQTNQFMGYLQTDYQESSKGFSFEGISEELKRSTTYLLDHVEEVQQSIAKKQDKLQEKLEENYIEKKKVLSDPIREEGIQ